MLAGPSEAQQNLYGLAFVQNCLLLLVRVHGKLNRRSLQTAEETHITGELVRRAKALIESDEADPWMEHLEVLDDSPQSVPGRYGKNRPRIDFEFVRTGHGLRRRFHLEAKRLYRSGSINEYFGPRGLQMFTRGEFAHEWPSAGMLGYVQSENCSTWLGRLVVGFAARSSDICACSGLTPVGWEDLRLEGVHTSQHQRTLPTTQGPIEILHLLLEFT
jgi:hypothetical protein